MKEKISVFQYQEIIGKIKFLKSEDDRIFGMLCKFMEIRICLPNELIFLEGNISKGLYVLKKGKIFSFISAVNSLFESPWDFFNLNYASNIMK